MTASNAAASYTFDYYTNGWLKSVDDGATRIDYQYDAAGRRELVTVKQGTTTLQTLDYAYNPTSNRLENINSSAAGTFSFGYDGSGRRKSLTYPNGVNASYSYQAEMDWLTGIDYPEIGLSIGYPKHDKAGNRKERTENGIAAAYTYDATYQLTQAKTGAEEENFTYDAVGNRESGPTVKDTPAAAYEHDAANRMTFGRKFGYAYDARGNQTRRYLSSDQSQRWEFTWDGENQLSEAKLIADGATLRTVSFKYDPFGRRTQKQVSQAGGTLTTSYIYDGEDIVLQVASDGATETTTQYVHGPGIDEPLAMVRGSQKFFFHADGLGSVVAISDANKSIVQRYTYESFGMLTPQEPGFENAYTYTGREWDKEIGLYYYRARYYDPMEGRFVSKDPIGLAGGDVNIYRYVGNNSLNWVDFFGLAPGDPYATQQKAAQAAIDDVNPSSILSNSEYGGMIYENKGTFSYTSPQSGGEAAVDPGGPASCPSGSTPQAYYHTHGGPDPRYDSENFSSADKKYGNYYNIDGYVGTPSGDFKHYNHATGSDSSVGKVKTK